MKQKKHQIPPRNICCITTSTQIERKKSRNQNAVAAPELFFLSSCSFVFFFLLFLGKLDHKKNYLIIYQSHFFSVCLSLSLCYCVCMFVKKSNLNLEFV